MGPERQSFAFFPAFNGCCVCTNAVDVVAAEDGDAEGNEQTQEQIDGDPGEIGRVGAVFNAIGERAAEHGDQVNAAGFDVDEQADKVAIIGKANAIIHPRTMVIHFQHANAARAAMVCARRLVVVAALAKSRLVCRPLDFKMPLLLGYLGKRKKKKMA